MNYKTYFHLLYVLWVQCFIVSLPLTVRNLITDQFALLEFKDRITGDPRDVLANNWTASNSVCNWIGVSCGVVHARVVALNLSNMNLTGTIPPHLGNLSFLRSLELSSNNFHGHLPSELGHLHRLRFIQLSFNQLSGELPRTLVNMSSLEILNMRFNQLSGRLPSSIFGITSLRKIDFRENSLSGALPHDLCVQLPKLEQLSLGRNELSGSIPTSIGKCTNLQILELAGNKFSGVIPRSLGNLTQLREIFLGLNNLEGEIPEEIGNLLNLEELNIQLIEGLTGEIPTSIYNISSLKFIALANNSLSGGLPNDLCRHLSKLEELYLDANELSGNIPSSIGQCYNLRVLQLSKNQFSGNVPKSIWNSTKLQVITLGANNLEGNLPPMTRLPKLELILLWENKFIGNILNSVSNASMLKSLDIGENLFSGLIPDTLGNLRQLEWFRITNNYFTTDSATHEWSFLSSLANCRNLTRIGVSRNPLNGILPAYIGNLSTSFQYFDAQGCELKGNIPMEIGNLSNMYTLELGFNTLSGLIPASVGRLQNLQSLGLSSNKLGGSISESICGLERLYALFLALNKLNGSIPSCFGNLIALRYLNLYSNRLSSAIPSTLWNLRDILEMDLSSNYLNNSEALDFGGMRSVLRLNLSRNRLTGDISSAIGGLLTLVSLDLSNNKLHGHIPESFGGLISLEFLDLCNNSLSGVIPKSLEKLSHLNYFNVSFNRLEGEIPTTGCFTNFSSTSFMNNYALCGPPRLLLPPCKNNIDKDRKMTVLQALRYGIPTIGIVLILILLTITYRKCQNGSTTLPVEDDLLSLETWRKVSQDELSHATAGFDESNLLGSGSFGHVYKGRLSDGLEVAIKVFNLQREGALRSFDIECEAMSKLVHRNLVKVITCCSNANFKALVLDFMSNGSLETWLHSKKCSLDIVQRIDIMIDVAAALEHLHTGHHVPVIHCDLKPSNILLDKDMVAHLGDFGIAKLLGEDDATKQTITLATIGYMAPEFGSTGTVSIKCDVYSYGIVLIETFTKRRPTDKSFVEEMNIRHWMKSSLSKGIEDVVDVDLLRTEDDYFVAKINCISSIMELALNCSTHSPDERKDMKNVVVELKKIKQRFLNSAKQVLV